MNKIDIDCVGGLGNRLSSLIGGLEIANVCELHPVIHWHPSHSCFAKFSDLFDTSLEIKEVSDFADSYDFTEYLSSHTVVVPDVPDILEKVKSSKLPILHFNPKIPQYLDIASTVQNLLQLKPKKEIIDNVSCFVSQSNIDSNVIGVHIRKTDHSDIRKTKNERLWYDTVLSHPSQRFFICSDSQETENKFASLSNTIVLPKNEYVTKRFDGQPWRIREGKVKYNVSRSSGSVIEALHDLLILSHTNIQTTSRNSSFLHFATYYGSILKDVMH